MPQTVAEAELMAIVAPEPRAWVVGVMERKVMTVKMTMTVMVTETEEEEGSFVI